VRLQQRRAVHRVSGKGHCVSPRDWACPNNYLEGPSFVMTAMGGAGGGIILTAYRDPPRGHIGHFGLPESTRR
jgi:hypothetical protein